METRVQAILTSHVFADNVKVHVPQRDQTWIGLLAHLAAKGQLARSPALPGKDKEPSEYRV